MINEDLLTPKINLKTTYNFLQPYSNRQNFKITWNENSVLCGGVFYSKDNEALKITKFFQISSASLIYFFMRNKHIPSINYNRKLLSNFTTVMSKSNSLIICQKSKLIVLKRNIFIFNKLVHKMKKQFLPIQFSGKFGMFLLGKVFRSPYPSRDIIIVLGYEKKGDNHLRLILFDVKRKKKLYTFNLQECEITGKALEIHSTNNNLIIIGNTSKIKNQYVYNIYTMELSSRTIRNVNTFTNRRFTKVRKINFLTEIAGLQ